MPQQLCACGCSLSFQFNRHPRLTDSCNRADRHSSHFWLSKNQTKPKQDVRFGLHWNSSSGITGLFLNSVYKSPPKKVRWLADSHTQSHCSYSRKQLKPGSWYLRTIPLQSVLGDPCPWAEATWGRSISCPPSWQPRQISHMFSVLEISSWFETSPCWHLPQGSREHDFILFLGCFLELWHRTAA